MYLPVDVESSSEEIYNDEKGIDRGFSKIILTTEENLAIEENLVTEENLATEENLITEENPGTEENLVTEENLGTEENLVTKARIGGDVLDMPR